MPSPRSTPQDPAFLEHVIVHYRWVFVLFLLPVSLVYDVLYYARSSLVFWMSSAPGRHPEKVAEVQRQVRARMDEGDQRQMCTARPGWQTISPQYMRYKERMRQIKVNLVDVLDIDTERRTITCEPLVSMGQLTHTLDKLGWTIPILPELDDLTVGGLVMGTGIETSSHKYGLFQHICESFELVLADGSVVTCSESENSDLFFAVPWSYGTLGFLVSVKIKIIPSKRFVKLDYIPVKSMEECMQVMKTHIDSDSPPEFVEALAYSKDKAVVMTGEMTDSCGDLSTLNEIGRWHKPWFFKHVEEFADRNRTGSEYIPLRHYYHRHSRSIFWEIQDIIPFGNNVVFRYLLGWLIPPKVSLLKLTQGKTLKKLYEDYHIIQDMLVPIDVGAKSLDFFHEEVEVYPIWLCPFRLPNNPGMLNSRGDNKNSDEMYLDIGVYGVPKEGYRNEATTRKVESFVRANRGFQMMYADSYMTKDEFESMFDHTLYREMRARHGCKGAFPEVYDKVNKKARAS